MSGKLQKLVILHTNDIHSHFGQVPGVTSVIRSLKDRYRDVPLVTVDCGDHMDRVRLETEGSLGKANVALMNEAGYDLAVLGNNEGLTFSRRDLEAAYAQAGFTLIGDNLAERETGKPPSWLKARVVRRMGGIRVGFIGVTAYFPDFYSLLGWEVLDPFVSTARALDDLRGQADLIVVISHLGYPIDRKLATDLKGIDLILGAHTHHLLEKPERVGDTHICAAGKFGMHVGCVELLCDPETKRPVAVSGSCIPSSDAAEDPAALRIIREYEESGRRNLQDTAAYLEEPLEIDWSAESRLGNLLAAGLRDWVGADIGLVNAGQLLEGLEKGPVTRERLLAICPPPINPCRMQLCGWQILEALEQSLLAEFTEKPIRGFGFRGKVLGMLCVDGLHIEYDPRREPMRRIVGAWHGDEPLKAERTYSVGTIDMFTFRIGYLTLSEGTDIRYYLPEFLRNVLERQLRQPTAIEESKLRRWIRR